jgi:hypothetical protein
LFERSEDRGGQRGQRRQERGKGIVERRGIVKR